MLISRLYGLVLRSTDNIRIPWPRATELSGHTPGQFRACVRETATRVGDREGIGRSEHWQVVEDPSHALNCAFDTTD
jgi:hypothetical protein